MTPLLGFSVVQDGSRSVSETREQFVQAVRTLYEDFRAEGPAPRLPVWASDYRLPGETELRAEISDANEQIEALKEQATQRTEELDNLCLHKLLVTGHDSALEGAVDRALTDLGMKVERGPKGRVDRTATYGDGKFAIEVQGRQKGCQGGSRACPNNLGPGCGAAGRRGA